MNNDKDCVFCKMVRGEIKVEKVAENDKFFVIRDIKPVAKGHSLIIPKEHFVDILNIPDKIGVELINMIKKVGNNLINEGYGEGFNVVCNNGSSAGQVVMHSHIHVIPRKDGDGIRLVSKI